MDCLILTRVLDVHPNTYTSKSTGKEVSYVAVSVLDEEATFEANRVLVLQCQPDVVKGLELVNKYWKVKGSLSTSKFGMRFTPLHFEESK